MSNIKEIKVKIEGEKWNKAKEEAFNKVKKEIRIDGFRKGKAPKDIIIKKYGEENLWLDAANMCIQEAYQNMIEENKDLEIVTRPDGTVSALTADYVEFLFTLTLRPISFVKVTSPFVTVTVRVTSTLPSSGIARQGAWDRVPDTGRRFAETWSFLLFPPL